MDKLQFLLWALGGFLLGALPFSVWVTQWVAGRDVRAYGDGNPGASNAFAAGGPRAGALALALDFSKGALPAAVYLYLLGASGPALVALSLTPILGHAASPFLRGRGGKALAATFGVWAGLTLGEVPIVLGLLLGIFKVAGLRDGLALALGWTGLGAHLAFSNPDPVLGWLWALNGTLLLWKYRHSLLASFPAGATITDGGG